MLIYKDYKPYSFTPDEDATFRRFYVPGSKNLSTKEIDKLLYPWDLKPFKRMITPTTFSALFIAGAITLNAFTAGWWLLLELVLVGLSVFTMAVAGKRSVFEYQLKKIPTPAFNIVHEDDIRTTVLFNTYVEQKLETAIEKALQAETGRARKKEIASKATSYRSFRTSAASVFDVNGYSLQAIVYHASSPSENSYYINKDSEMANEHNADDILAEFFADSRIQELVVHLSRDIGDTVRQLVIDELRALTTIYTDRLHALKASVQQVSARKKAQQEINELDEVERAEAAKIAQRELNEAEALKAVGIYYQEQLPFS